MVHAINGSQLFATNQAVDGPTSTVTSINDGVVSNTSAPIPNTGACDLNDCITRQVTERVPLMHWLPLLPIK